MEQKLTLAAAISRLDRSVSRLEGSMAARRKCGTGAVEAERAAIIASIEETLDHTLRDVRAALGHKDGGAT